MLLLLLLLLLLLARRLGLLAAALGDGSMRVWAVPHPQTVARDQQQAGGAVHPVLLTVPPVAAITSAQLGGSMPCLVDWLPAAPHDLLLVGCWDGSVALLKLTPGQQPQPPAASGSGGASSSGGGMGSRGMSGLQLLSHFNADLLPLRALRWMPPAACRSATDMLHRHVFLTGGHEGTLRVWDIRRVGRW